MGDALTLAPIARRGRLNEDAGGIAHSFPSSWVGSRRPIVELRRLLKLSVAGHLFRPRPG
jgi:hypothetical protein